MSNLPRIGLHSVGFILLWFDSLFRTKQLLKYVINLNEVKSALKSVTISALLMGLIDLLFYLKLAVIDLPEFAYLFVAFLMKDLIYVYIIWMLVTSIMYIFNSFLSGRGHFDSILIANSFPISAFAIVTPFFRFLSFYDILAVPVTILEGAWFFLVFSKVADYVTGLGKAASYFQVCVILATLGILGYLVTGLPYLTPSTPSYFL